MKKAICVVVVVLLVMALSASAGDWSRANKTDFFGVLQTMSSDTTSGLGLDMEIDNSVVYGVGFGKNLNDNFNINMDLLFGSTSVEASNGNSVSPTEFLWDLNLDYNILKSRLTPLVSAGIGFLFLTGSDYGETDFSYNLGVGARWDATDNLFVKAMYKWTWTKLQDTDSGVCLDGFTLCVGYMW